jgi:arylformamidase
VRLDDASEAALSPIRHLGDLNVPLIVAWGSKESPEFIRQGKAFVSTGKALGKRVKDIQVSELNHFEILQTLAQKQSSIGRAALDLVDPQFSTP